MLLDSTVKRTLEPLRKARLERAKGAAVNWDPPSARLQMCFARSGPRFLDGTAREGGTWGTANVGVTRHPKVEKSRVIRKCESPRAR